MTNGERYKIFKAWFESIGFPEMHESYKDAFWQGFEAGHRIASKTNEAAPELLSALNEIVEASTAFHSALEIDQSFDGEVLYSNAVKAIKKASGE